MKKNVTGIKNILRPIWNRACVFAGLVLLSTLLSCSNHVESENNSSEGVVNTGQSEEPSVLDDYFEYMNFKRDLAEIDSVGYYLSNRDGAVTMAKFDELHGRRYRELENIFTPERLEEVEDSINNDLYHIDTTNIGFNPALQPQ